MERIWLWHGYWNEYRISVIQNIWLSELFGYLNIETSGVGQKGLDNCGWTEQIFQFLYYSVPKP